MSKYGSLAQIALPYSEALFESSQLMKQLDQTNEDLKFIIKIITNSKPLSNFLANPLIVSSVKKEVLQNLFQDQISNHVLNFLSILIERRRISLLDLIVNNYFNLVYQLELTTVANIYSTIVLSDSQKQNLEKQLKLITGSKKMELIVHIEPELIGGLVIKIGSKVIDMSIAGQLNHIASYLNVSRV